MKLKDKAIKELFTLNSISRMYRHKPSRYLKLIFHHFWEATHRTKGYYAALVAIYVFLQIHLSQIPDPGLCPFACKVLKVHL